MGVLMRVFVFLHNTNLGNKSEVGFEILSKATLEEAVKSFVKMYPLASYRITEITDGLARNGFVYKQKEQ